MKLSVATNWDGELLKGLATLPVTSVFGKLASDVVGGARPTCVLPEPTATEAAAHIAQARAAKIEFNYLLNASCLGGDHFTRQRHRQLTELLDWLQELRVGWVTVSNPYLLKFVKSRWDFKVKIGALAGVRTVKRARWYERLGADAIVLEEWINRDFRLLEKIRKNVSIDIELIVNNSCMLECPFRLYHLSQGSHASIDSDPCCGFYVDYSLLRCLRHKLDPTELIKAPWIRPEDLQKYEAIGIDHFKIVDRTRSTNDILIAAKAYGARNYNGDLLFLLGPDGLFFKPKSTPAYFASHLLNRPDLINMAKYHRVIAGAFSIRVDRRLENKLLDGFIDFFAAKKQSCRVVDCRVCKYCHKWAKQAVKINIEQATRAQQRLDEAVDAFLSGELFSILEAETPVKWSDTAVSLLNNLMKLVPDFVRETARIHTQTEAENICRNAGQAIVLEKHVIEAFISQVPQDHKHLAIQGLEELGLDASEEILTRECDEKQ